MVQGQGHWEKLPAMLLEDFFLIGQLEKALSAQTLVPVRPQKLGGVRNQCQFARPGVLLPAQQ